MSASEANDCAHCVIEADANTQLCMFAVTDIESNLVHVFYSKGIYIHYVGGFNPLQSIANVFRHHELHNESRRLFETDEGARRTLVVHKTFDHESFSSTNIRPRCGGKRTRHCASTLQGLPEVLLQKVYSFLQPRELVTLDLLFVHERPLVHGRYPGSKPLVMHLGKQLPSAPTDERARIVCLSTMCATVFGAHFNTPPNGDVTIRISRGNMPTSDFQYSNVTERTVWLSEPVTLQVPWSIHCVFESEATRSKVTVFGMLHPP